MPYPTPETSFVQGVRKKPFRADPALGRMQLHNSVPAVAIDEIDPSGLINFVNRTHSSRLTTSQRLATPKTRTNGLTKGALAEVLHANLLFDSDRIDALHFLHNEIAAMVIAEAFEDTESYDISGSSLEIFRSGLSRNPMQRFMSPMQSTGIRSGRYLGLTIMFGRLNYDARFKDLHPLPPNDFDSINGMYAMPTSQRGEVLDTDDFRVKSMYGTGFILGSGKSALCAPLLHEGRPWSPSSNVNVVEGYNLQPGVTEPLRSGTVYELHPTTMLSIPRTDRELSQIALRLTLAYKLVA